MRDLKRPGDLYLQIRAADYEAAVAVLQSGAGEIGSIRSSFASDLSAASFVSGVMRLPDGPAISVDVKDEPLAVRRAMLDVLVRHAEAAGLDCVIGPPANRLDAPFFAGVPDWVPGVRYPRLLLRSRKAPRAPGFRRPPIPPSWVGPLLDWVLRDIDDSDDVWVGIVGAAFRAPAEVARTMLDPPAGGIVNIAAGQGSLRMLTYSWSGLIYEARLRTKGPDIRDSDAADVAVEFRHLARAVATDVDYAAVDYDEPGVHDPKIRRAIDTSTTYPAFQIPDVAPWQIISPHHAFLVSDHAPPGRALPGGRREVAFGTFDEWREPGDSWASLHAEALQLLGPLLELPYHLFVPGAAESGTLEEITTKLEAALPGGVWSAPSLYQLVGDDYALDVEISRFGLAMWPAGARAVAQAHRAASAFPGEMIERPSAGTDPTET
jgi:hypothetical protein